MMRQETIDRATTEAKRLSDEAWRGVTRQTQTKEADLWPQLVVAGILGGVSAAGVFSLYHEELGRAMPEAAMLGGLMTSGAVATYAAQMAAKNNVPIHWTFFATSISLGGVYAVANKYLETTKKPKTAPLETLPSVAPQALAGLALGVAATAVAASYW
jgi:hypothetical protein